VPLRQPLLPKTLTLLLLSEGTIRKTVESERIFNASVERRRDEVVPLELLLLNIFYPIFLQTGLSTNIFVT